MKRILLCLLIIFIFFVNQSYADITPIKPKPTLYDKKQDKKINTNEKDIKQNKKEIDKVEKESIKRDNSLSDNIITNKDNISINKKKIVDVDDKHIIWNKKQDKILNDHNNRLNDHENRINELEETQYNVEGVLRVLDTKKTTIEIYNTYDIRHSREVAVGVRFTYKFGKSYTDRKLEELENKINELQKKGGIEND